MRTRSPDFLLARQPIFDRQRTVVAYELLYRSSADRNTALFIDDALATTSVVNAAFRTIGISAVVGDARALVNVNAEFLLSRAVEQLPQNKVMLEILETVDIDEQIVRRCRALKEKGYQLALDDVCHYNEKFEPLLEFIDVVKIDVMQLDSAALARLVQQLRPWPVRLLGEKLDTVSRVKQCLELGMDWLQGFFYGQPVLLPG
jgi:EAL and modified HD-GYP domain-containing signal transduction protein